MESEVHYHIHKSPLLDPFQSQRKSFHILIPCLFAQIYFKYYNIKILDDKIIL
jgi:hypothetical protein